MTSLRWTWPRQGDWFLPGEGTKGSGKFIIRNRSIVIINPEKNELVYVSRKTLFTSYLQLQGK